LCISSDVEAGFIYPLLKKSKELKPLVMLGAVAASLLVVMPLME
jgi:hypothetical protein